MNQSEPHPPNESPAPVSGADREIGVPSRPPGRAPLARWTALQYVMLPGAAALCLQLSLLDPRLKIAGSAAVMGAFWIGFGRLNRAGVLAILGACALLSAKNFPPIYVALMACSALAGWVGAWLSAREAEEDDFFFLPAGALGLALAGLITLGVGGGWAEVLERTARMIEPWRREWLTHLSAMREAAQAGDWVTRWFFSADDALLARRTGLALIALIVCLWVAALWLAGRLARRVLGRMRGVRTSLIVFRIQVRYIFLLILGLVLEIFSSLGVAPWADYLAWPLLGAIALAGFLDGLGILLFLAAIRRMTGQPTAAFWLGALGVATALFYPEFVALFGLADVWLDVRKLERLKQQLEAGTDEPEE